MYPPPCGPKGTCPLAGAAAGEGPGMEFPALYESVVFSIRLHRSIILHR